MDTSVHLETGRPEVDPVKLVGYTEGQWSVERERQKGVSGRGCAAKMCLAKAVAPGIQPARLETAWSLCLRTQFSSRVNY
jgi:hypothetical protein